MGRILGSKLLRMRGVWLLWVWGRLGLWGELLDYLLSFLPSIFIALHLPFTSSPYPHHLVNVLPSHK